MFPVPLGDNAISALVTIDEIVLSDICTLAAVTLPETVRRSVAVAVPIAILEFA